jgi:hypothetical protein
MMTFTVTAEERFSNSAHQTRVFESFSVTRAQALRVNNQMIA